VKDRLLPAGLALASAPLLGGCVVATTSRSGGGGGFFFLLLPLLMFFLIARMMRAGARGGTTRRKVRYAPEPARGDEPEVSPQMLRAELSVLADDVLRLEPQVALNDAARDDYEAATHRYRVAQAAIDQAQEHVDLVRVQRVVDEARWAMSRARAILEGRRPPEPPPALQQPGSHGEPAVRLDGRQNPMYVGSPAPFRSGWFSTGTGMFGGLLLGSMLGGWMMHDSSDAFGDGGFDGGFGDGGFDGGGGDF
jgi:hypothetical protein